MNEDILNQLTTWTRNQYGELRGDALLAAIGMSGWSTANARFDDVKNRWLIPSRHPSPVDLAIMPQGSMYSTMVVSNAPAPEPEARKSIIVGTSDGYRSGATVEPPDSDGDIELVIEDEYVFLSKEDVEDMLALFD